jgi:hypothetical protein
VVFKGLIAAVTAVALSTTPALAAANQAGTVARVGSEVTPADESVDGDSELFRRGGFIIPFIVIIVILLGIYIAVDDKGNGAPISPG